VLKVGYVGGKHFTEYVEKVKTLKRNGENEKAIKLLLKLVSATEKESNKNQMGVAVEKLLKRLEKVSMKIAR
jgi:uncharacterized Fe-S cluster-containing MiaB family protein